ncbi:MAG: prephenate dehydrogenase/arogenate dehydrogenase family protein [Clostridiales bacterium]|jgi:prephenate dehydrogenase|nr:prephenate dehydrogenase/arogenate dehydrogenase family protein [Clostridiales bacterium]
MWIPKRKRINFLPFDPEKAVEVGIVGLGQIGASLALALRAGNPHVHIVGVDSDAATLEHAFVENIIQLGNPSYKILKGVKAVFVCVPAAETPRALADVYAVVGGDAAVCDIAGCKTKIMKGLPRDMRYVGGRPLAGNPHAGILTAKLRLFEGRPFCLTEGHCKEADMERVQTLVALTGAQLVVVTAAELDGWTARKVQLPALVAAAVRTCRRADDAAAEPWGRDTALDILAEIDITDFVRNCMDNADGVANALAKAAEQLGALQDLVEERGEEGLTSYLNDAVPPVGAEPPLHTVICEFPAALGGLARATRVLAKHAIGLEDIHVVRVRDDRSSVLRFSFENAEDGLRARRLFAEKKIKVLV